VDYDVCPAAPFVQKAISAFGHGKISELIIITSFPCAFNKNIVNMNSLLRLTSEFRVSLWQCRNHNFAMRDKFELSIQIDPGGFPEFFCDWLFLKLVIEAVG